MPFKMHTAGLTVAIRLTPNARRDALQGLADGGNGITVLRAAVSSPPEDGKANKALIALLAACWRLPKSSFSLLSGHSSRIKVVLLAGDGAQLLARLRQQSPDLFR